MHLCGICGKVNKNINRHIREVHKLDNYVPTTLNSNNKCLEGCSISFNWLKDLRYHLEEKHNFKLDVEHLKFSTLVEFNTWYDDLCYTKNLQYNKHKQITSTAKGSITYYNCNRSGSIKEIQSEKRSKKIQGSCKLNYSCTSQIILIEQRNGYEVTYHKTHYGHAIELQHIRLPKKERCSVAAKLASGVTLNRILDDVRDNIDDNFRRSDLMTRRDLLNIKSAFGINNKEDKIYKKDTFSFEVWLEKQKKSENNCILFYKKQGVKLSESTVDLKEEDLCLIIMNKFQKSMLERFGEQIVIIENTRGQDTDDFELTTLMVIDENGEGFPTAYMFSNHNNVFIHTVFFSYLKDNCGIITPKVFMTDITDVYYNAWIQIMNVPTFRFYCPWHIDRAWNTNLNKICMLEKRNFVCKIIKYLETNLDEDDFKREFEKSIDIFIKDHDTRKFGYYFKNNFLDNVKMWAYCYRKECNINNNIHVESIQASFQNLDKAIQAVLTFIRKKTVNRIVKLTKGKNYCHIEQIVSCHERAITTKFNVETVNNNQYKVHIEGERCYIIKKQNQINICCQLICEFCQICIHVYTCGCTDFLVETTICKHIHIVAIKNNSNRINESNTKQYQQIDDKVALPINNLGSSNKESMEIEKIRTYTYSMLSFIKTQVFNLSNNMDVMQIKNSLDQIMSQLNIIKAKVHTLPVNKDIDIKLPSHSRKRKRRCKDNTGLEEPNLEEANDIRAILFQ